MLQLGNAQQYDINPNISSFYNMRKKIGDFTDQEFSSEVKRIVDNDWKRLLATVIIESCSEKDFPNSDPILTGGICFDHHNSCQLSKWYNFGKASFILARVQFIDKNGNTYVTFNTVIWEYDKAEDEIEFIDEEITSLLQFCNELLNGEKQYVDDVHNISFDSNHHTELKSESVLLTEILKQIHS